MKKLLLTIALVSAIAFTGCSNNQAKPADNNSKTEQSSQKAEIKQMKGAELEAIEQDKKKKRNCIGCRR